MFYPNDAKANCLLNSETRKTKADKFVAEDASVTMIYADAPDAAAARQLRDTPISGSGNGWTMWTKCENSISYRYKNNCGKNDIRKCTREARNCNGM
jgi:hypothetical protein